MKPIRKLQPGRMYEITGLPANHPWTARGANLLGAVVSDVGGHHSSGHIRAEIHKHGPCKIYLTRITLDMHGVTFRPLNQKDQKAIEEQNRGSE